MRRSGHHAKFGAFSKRRLSLVSAVLCISIMSGAEATEHGVARAEGAIDLGYYHALAREGSADAQLVLGDHFRSGTEGVEKNLTEAYAWYYVAAQQGVEEAITPMIEVLLELSPEQQHRAKAIAEDYAARYAH